MGAVIEMPIKRIRNLRDQEQQLMSRALETWAWRARKEARELDKAGEPDAAHAFYQQADHADRLIELLPWMRMTAGGQ